jgi:hypothetical protein
LIGVILICPVLTDVMVIVHLLCILLGMLMRLMTVPCIRALGLGQLVYLRTNEADQGLFGEGMRDRLACGKIKKI